MPVTLRRFRIELLCIENGIGVKLSAILKVVLYISIDYEQKLAGIKRIAIMGGTFDPIHIGHLASAEAVRHQFNFDKIFFIPSGTPPHKQGREITSPEHRYLMTELSILSNNFFDVLRIDIDREGFTYTIDTLFDVKKYCDKNAKIFFITGADAIHEIISWKNHVELLNGCNFIAITRPGYDKTSLYGKIEEFTNKYNSSIELFEVPALAISSTDIRNRVKNDSPIKYMVTENVEKYIEKFKLYVK